MEINLRSIKKMSLQEKNPLVALLQRLPLFEGIDVLSLDALTTECPLESYGSGVTILSEGDESNGQAFVILSGTVDIYIGGNKITSLGAGAIFGEYTLICSEKRSATVCTSSTIECLILDESSILKIADETNKLSDILMERIIQNNERSR